MKRVLLDGMAVSRHGRGVSRTLQHVLPLLAKHSDGAEYLVVTSPEGRDLLPGPDDDQFIVVPQRPKSAWEQMGLPLVARHLGASAIYTFSECGPLWGVLPLVHVPEDPYVRWLTAPARTAKEHARRAYERTVMQRSLQRAAGVLACSSAIAERLRNGSRGRLQLVEVVPLGVDTATFHPGAARPTEDTIFHIGADEARDQTALLVQAYVMALELAPDLPDLVVAGDLGPLSGALGAKVALHRLAGRVHQVGRVTDEELRRYYFNSAICVLPSEYEGFGLQPLEALACGAALIVSDDPAVVEVVEGAAVVLSDCSAEALATAIVETWADPAKRNALRLKGPLRAAQFSWDATAERLHELLVEATQQRGPSPRVFSRAQERSFT
jgi:glycosyltransferase involved in cell wall biosynthesis